MRPRRGAEPLVGKGLSRLLLPEVEGSGGDERNSSNGYNDGNSSLASSVQTSSTASVRRRRGLGNGCCGGHGDPAADNSGHHLTVDGLGEGLDGIDHREVCGVGRGGG